MVRPISRGGMFIGKSEDSMERNTARQNWTAHRLLQFGVLLFLLGLLSGFVTPALANPRMGLSSHLEGVMNGTFLVILGLL
jgi:hypothetical protein